MTADSLAMAGWEAFVYHWAKYHGVEMSAAARAALVRAIPPPELMIAFPPCQDFASSPPAPAPAPAAPQGALF